jgi:uncharacterized phage protein (TIGR02220 family)
MRATSHLSMLEDAAYRRLLDAYYVREAPIPADIKQACRLARASSAPEREAVETVLHEFFELHDEGWHNSRADQEIAFAQAKAGKNREVGKLGGRPPKVETKKVSENNHDGSETETQTVPKNNPSHKPVTSNQVNLKTLSANADMSGKPSAVPDVTPIPNSETPKNGQHFNPLAREVLGFLNAKTGRHYQPVDANLKLIVARLKEGASVADCRAVVAKKCREWSADEKMGSYLRPATLFNATKFAQYRGELLEVATDD